MRSRTRACPRSGRARGIGTAFHHQPGALRRTRLLRRESTTSFPAATPATPAAPAVLHKRFPDLPNIPVGKPNTHDELIKDMNVFDGSKATKVLGIKYIPFEETVVEMADSLKKRFTF
jgi:hypothetical protein